MFRITAAIVIAIGVRESLSERNVAVVTAVVTVIGIAAANNRRYPLATPTRSAWAPTARRMTVGNRISGRAVQVPKTAAKICPSEATLETAFMS
ncbi:MAG: hypothetical protein WB586_26430 [Chthoniobacterales bacterium]